MKCVLFLVFAVSLLFGVVHGEVEIEEKKAYDPWWCNANSDLFQERNGFQVKSVGNWSQTVSYLAAVDPSNPGYFRYIQQSRYFQVNSYDQRNCRFLSVQGWPSCQGPLTQAVFPDGLYLQTVAQPLVIDRSNPTAAQQYNPTYLTPAVPIVPAQDKNKWVSIAMGSGAISNIVYEIVDNEVTDQVVYMETISVVRNPTLDEPGHRVYLPGVVVGEAITAIAPFDSVGVTERPAPYDVMIDLYIDGHVPLSYMRSCDAGATWALSNCNTCGARRIQTPCAACENPAQELCLSTYYMPFPSGQNPCVQ